MVTWTLLVLLETSRARMDDPGSFWGSCGGGRDFGEIFVMFGGLLIFLLGENMF